MKLPSRHPVNLAVYRVQAGAPSRLVTTSHADISGVVFLVGGVPGVPQRGLLRLRLRLG